MTTQTAERLTVAEFFRQYGHCSGVELVRGRVVWAGQGAGPAGGRMPHFKHGVVARKAAKLIGDFVDAHKLGWVATNDTFVTADADEGTVRGADLLFVSYARLPPGGGIPDQLTVPPELVVEVRSPTDRSGDLNIKVGEYQNAGVDVVVVLDPRLEAATVHRGAGEFSQVMHNGDEFTLPDVLPGFAVPVAEFFRP
jgi:Uma2 family endonuclease